MKKVLFATTALVAFAGAASADVSISGSAEMGVVGGGTAATNGSGGETQFWNDVDIKFTLTGESDSGLSFGAVVDLDEGGNLGNQFRNQGTSVFLSGNFGTLTMGDTDGALDWALTDAGANGNPGSIADDETSHAGYVGAYGDGGAIGNLAGNVIDNQILRYDYSFDSFGVAISYEQGATGVCGAPTPGLLCAGDPNGAWAIGLRYALDLGGTTVNLGAGYHSTDYLSATDQSILGISAAASFGGGFQAGLVYSQWNDIYGVAGADADHIGIGLGYESGPIALHANWGQWDPSGPGATIEGWGIAAAYDLGGGLSANLGYGDSDMLNADSWSFGMVMSF